MPKEKTKSRKKSVSKKVKEEKFSCGACGIKEHKKCGC